MFNSLKKSDLVNLQQVTDLLQKLNIKADILEKKKKKNSIWLIIGIILILVAVAGFVVYKFVLKKDDEFDEFDEYDDDFDDMDYDDDYDDFDDFDDFEDEDFEEIGEDILEDEELEEAAEELEEALNDEIKE